MCAWLKGDGGLSRHDQLVTVIPCCFLLARVEEETKVEPADQGSPGEQRWCATLALKSTSTGNVSGLVRQSQAKLKVSCVLTWAVICVLHTQILLFCSGWNLMMWTRGEKLMWWVCLCVSLTVVFQHFTEPVMFSFYSQHIVCVSSAFLLLKRNIYLHLRNSCVADGWLSFCHTSLYASMVYAAKMYLSHLCVAS